MRYDYKEEKKEVLEILRSRNKRQWLNLQLVMISVIVFTVVCLMLLINALLLLFRHVFALQFRVATWVFVALMSVSLSIVASVFLAKVILYPLVKLSEQLEKAANGDFSIELKTNSKIAEVRKLYDSFNRMQRQLRRTEMLQSDFITNVSHEFKTPIAAIEGYATLLQDTENETERKEYIERILLNSARLSDLAGNILLLSKLENCAVDIGKDKFSLDEQIRQAVVLLEPQWTKKNLDIDAELDEIEFCGNEGITYRVWYNLIHNAVKFSPEGGKLEVRLFEDSNRCIFTVKDEGPGIEPDKIEQIYDKFYQADSSRKSEGNGLGLSLAKRVITLYGGEIYAENMTNGCRFTVVLPIRKNEK